MSNYACIGYMIMAMKQAGFKDEDIEKATKEVMKIFDVVEEKEAERVCFED